MGIAPYLTANQVHLRWMAVKDMPAVLAIDAACFPDRGWDEYQFLKFSRDHDSIVMVAEDFQRRIAGFMVYALARREIRLVRLAVHPHARRSGVGRAMVSKLLGQLDPDHRRRLTLHVRESNLSACAFYRGVGIRAVAILPGHYGDEDGYLFEYRVSRVVS